MSAQNKKSLDDLQTIVIVGVGLIGGSIAAAVKQRSASLRVIGVGRSQARLDDAQRAGLLDAGVTDITAAAAEADLIIFCTPVDKIAEGIKSAAPHCRPGTLITDGGSIKGAICDAVASALPQDVHFVGSHPLAGSEKQGFEFADADLYDGRVCVVTPHEGCDPAAVESVAQFWRLLGSEVIEMTPAAHDAVLAETSHVPHLIASALAATLGEENSPFAASGFRDTTRIAAGDEHLWTAIFLGNREAMLAGLDRFEEKLASLRGHIEAERADELKSELKSARAIREGL